MARCDTDQSFEARESRHWHQSRVYNVTTLAAILTLTITMVGGLVSGTTIVVELQNGQASQSQRVGRLEKNYEKDIRRLEQSQRENINAIDGRLDKMDGKLDKLIEWEIERKR